MAGTTGGAGTGAASCDAPGTVFASYSCNLGGCHSTADSAAAFDMESAGWETKLVGTVPKGGGPAATASKCGATTTPYIVAKSNPATGLLIDKLMKVTPQCGARMPSIGGPLKTAEMDCVIQWATALANK